MPSKAVECQEKYDKLVIKKKWIIYVILFIAEIEMLFYSGILYGLNVLIPSLKKENYFYSQCIADVHPDNSTCLVQNQLFGYCLITGITGFSMSSLPLGIFYDKFGYRYTKIFSSLLFFVGALCFALSSIAPNELLFPGMLILGISAQSLAVGNLPLGSLVPKVQTLIVAFYVGSFDTSVIVFIFINLNYLAGFSFFGSFIIMAVTGLVLMELDGFLLMGAADQLRMETISKTLVSNKVEDIPDKQNTEQALDSATKELSLQDAHDKLSQYLDSVYPGIKQVLSSRHFLIQLMFYIIVFFRFSFFLAQLSMQLEKNFKRNKTKVPYFLSISSYFFMTSVLIAPISGIIVDSMKSKIKPTANSLEFYKNNLFVFAIPLVICCITNELMAIFIFIADDWAVYAAYMVFTITRAFLYTMTTSFILTAFPVKYFGIIFGITVTSGGIISFIQYGLLFEELVKLNIVNYVLVAVSALTFIHPILLFIKL